jgi:mitochondrial fission protein ELM1
VDGPKQVIILSDGIRGHVNQSRGVARWLSRLAGSGVHELEIPRLSGTRRFFALKIRSRKLPSADKDSAHRWLKESGGLVLCDEVGRICDEFAVSGADLLFLSAGSSAAPFTLALARFFGGRAATVMTPSVLGTGPFDFAIVPAHDFPPESPNVFQTLGAPNAIDPGDLKREADVLLQRYPSPAGKKWGVLIGGNDANYRVTPEWVRRRIRPLAEQAMIQGADLFVTTSRRTAPETEEALLELSAEFPVFRMLLLASKDPWNPVPGILGVCDEVFCTEDSVSMVSEAATAGFRVRLLRVERKNGVKDFLKRGFCWSIDKMELPRRFRCGVSRFDAMLSDFEKKGLIVEDGGEETTVNSCWGERRNAFNEAEQAARWILDRGDWKG